MTRRYSRPCVSRLAACVVTAAVAGGARGELNDVRLEWRPAVQAVEIGEVVELGLYAVAGQEPDQSIWVVEAILLWESNDLELLGLNDNGPYDWLNSYFPDDSQLDGLNAPFSGPAPFVPANDGNAWYNALRQLPPGPPATATPEGVLITTFQFRANGAGTTQVELPASFGQFTQTRILSVPGNEWVGTIGPPAVIEISAIPIPALSAWGLVSMGLLLLTVASLAFPRLRRGTAGA